MNYVRDYLEKIECGEVLVGNEIKQVYLRMVREMEESTSFYFSEKAGSHAIHFIETFCRHYEGELAGQVVKLELWQKAFVQNVFGWLEVGTDIRRFREYLLEVPRKHGKSFLSGCIATYMLVADGEQGAQVYTLATKYDQAKIVYDVARAIIEQSPELLNLVKPTREGMRFKATRSILKALASESKTMDGLNVHFACMDELHQIKDRNLYDVIRQGMKSRQQPLLGIITTSGFFREGIYDAQHEYATNVALGTVKDDRLFPVIYKLDTDDDWTDPKMWPKANPGLGTIKSYQQLADDVEKAKNDPSYLPTLLCKDFNLPQTDVLTWLPYDSCVNEKLIDINYLKKSYAIGGCDLSATTDLTCATLLIRKPHDEILYVLQKYFLPKSKVEDVTSNKEAPYKLWAEQGWLHVCDGATVDYHAVSEWFVSMVKEHDIRPLWICYDAALSGYWREEMDAYGFEMEKIRQGSFTWTYPMKRLGGLLTDHLVNYGNNPILRWCLLNTGAKAMNADGITSIQPVKTSRTKRIDGMVSLLNAYVGYCNHEDDYIKYIR
jgi:phage terminase large subunit-like protein